MFESSAHLLPATGLALFDAPGLPALGPDARPGVKSAAVIRAALVRLADEWEPAARRREHWLSAALLWHDHLDESHVVSQNLHDASGSFLHAIMHRREPDYGNSKYWWHRVGSHPCFPQLAGRAAALLAAQNQPQLKCQLLPDGDWDPFAFVDACERALRPGGNPAERELLRALQQAEFEVLLEHLCRPQAS